MSDPAEESKRALGQKEGRIQKRDKGSWENVQKCGSSGRDCWKKNYIQTNKTSGIKCTIQERERERERERENISKARL